jgi:hypothetical protein
MMNRATRNRVLNYFQSKGAKVHFNYGIQMVDEELTNRLENLKKWSMSDMA